MKHFGARVWIQILNVFFRFIRDITSKNSNNIKPFQPMNDSFLYPLKTSENQRFSDAFRVYRHGTLTRDALTKVERWILIAFIPFVVFRCTVVKMYGIFCWLLWYTYCYHYLWKYFVRKRQKIGTMIYRYNKTSDKFTIKNFFIYKQDHHYWYPSQRLIWICTKCIIQLITLKNALVSRTVQLENKSC